MQNKVGPAAIAVAAIVVIVFCIFLYKHFNPTLGGGASGSGVPPRPYANGNASPSANATPRSKG